MKLKSTRNEMQRSAAKRGVGSTNVFRSRLKWVYRAVVFALFLIIKQSADGQINQPILCSCGDIVFPPATCPSYSWGRDKDGDGYGDQNDVITYCDKSSSPPGYVKNTYDCNDNDAAINPATVWYLDADNDGYYTGSSVVSCTSPGPGYRYSGLLGGGDCNDAFPSVYPVTYYRDLDGDGYGDPANSFTQCSVVLQIAGYVLNNSDCNDNDPSINVARVWYRDADNDGYSDGTSIVNCSRPVSYKLASELNTTSGDCDDANPLIYPRSFYADADGDGYGNPNAAATFCTYGAPLGYVSNNTDCDDGDATLHTSYTYYRDGDGDGFGDPAQSMVACSSTPPSGYVTDNSDCEDAKILYADGDGDGFGAGSPVACGVDNNTDCNDADASIHAQATYYQDLDGDGFGNPGGSLTLCYSRPPAGYVTNNSDCNDLSPMYADADGDGYGAGYPVACGVPNNTDCNDNNSAISPATVWYLDADNDGYYTGSSVVSCTSPGAGYRYTGLLGGRDCNDAMASINPGAVEICGDGIDNNCNGQIDEGCSVTPAISINDVSVYESQGAAQLTVTLSNKYSKAVKVNYASQDGTAVSAGKTKDYLAVKGTLTIPAGSLIGTISVPILNDKLTESDEYLTVLLSKPTNGAILTKASATVTIKNGAPSALAKQSASGIEQVNENVSALSLVAVPNPSTNQFTLTLKGGSQQPAEMVITDILGRHIETYHNLSSNSTLRFGGNYRPGMYLVQVQQGTERATVKLIKQGN